MKLDKIMSSICAIMCVVYLYNARLDGAIICLLFEIIFQIIGIEKKLEEIGGKKVGR